MINGLDFIVLQQHVGKKLTSEVEDAMKNDTEFGEIRIVYPSTVLELDYRFDRANIYVDADNTITRIVIG